MQTQWRANNGAIIGLDYGVLPFVMRQSGMEDSAELFDDLQTMEFAALEELALRRG